eukprot:6188809-Pleurochrysis_carterae.AAC.4
MLRAALAQLGAWRAGGAGRLALWRETSAQHFAGGAYSAGAARPPPGTPCACVRAPSDASGSSDLNVVSARLEREIAPAHGVALVPFSNLTRARHDMHRAHFCSYHGQRRVGICCDCTHFCYSPLFWDAAFGGLLLALRQALLQDLRQARQGVHGAPRGLRAVAPAARGSGADAVAGARAREWLALTSRRLTARKWIKRKAAVEPVLHRSQVAHSSFQIVPLAEARAPNAHRTVRAAVRRGARLKPFSACDNNRRLCIGMHHQNQQGLRSTVAICEITTLAATSMCCTTVVCSHTLRPEV